MYSFIEIRKDASANRRSAAKHFCFPGLAADAPLHRDRVVDRNKPVAFLLCDAAAVIPQRAPAALSLRRAFLETLQKTPMHKGYARARALFDDLVHQTMGPMKRRERVDCA